jgi:diguanylate cyclase (GGDEF)-like protein
MTANRLEWIFVVDADTKNIVYCNKENISEESFLSFPCPNCPECKLGRAEILAWNGTGQEVWEIHIAHHKYLQVNSYPVNWNGRNSYVHVVTDISAQKLEKMDLSVKAYYDPVTSLHNRLYFEEYMQAIINEHRIITLGYLDLDGLKYVNDHYGHGEGDAYIRSFAALIQENFRKEDVFARIGGDEFCVVLEGRKRNFVRKKLEKIREALIVQNTRDYPVSFSYGVHEIDPGAENMTLDTVLYEADIQMYEYKRENKKGRS